MRIIQNPTNESEEIVSHAQEAYKAGEITMEELLWLSIYIAKYQCVVREEE